MMVEKTQEQIKAEVKAIMAEHRALLIKAIEDAGFDIETTLEHLHDEVIEYAENEGYHYCDDCDRIDLDNYEPDRDESRD